MSNPWTSAHISLLKQLHPIKSANNKDIEVWELNLGDIDQAIISLWAKHFRNHYCFDEEMDEECVPRGLTRKDYLIDLVFPARRRNPDDTSSTFGPMVRAGDFGEILFSDYLEFICKYKVSRLRWNGKFRNEPVKGCDVIGFKILDKGLNELVICESKTKLTSNNENCLQKAINSSKSDPIRLAESLNYLTRKSKKYSDNETREIIMQFVNPIDFPYNKKYIAAALYSVDHSEAQASTDNEHPCKSDLKLLLIKGDNLMSFIHELYERAANEA